VFSNLWLDFLLGAGIILIPLGLLILVMSMDLDKEDQNRAKRASIDNGSNSVWQSIEYIRFHNKVKSFKVHSIIIYLLICLLLGLLPLLDRLGFDWGWK